MLPIIHYREKIIESLKSHKKLIITAPPGAGKSTQIPQFFADQCTPEKKLFMLEPRRIAARSLAYRVAEEMGVECSREIGYQVRFERKASEKTKIMFLTYGTFLQFLHSDPHAAHSSVIVFDEFHERTLEADMALAWVRYLMRTERRDLEIMVLSATLEPAPLQKYLEGCDAIEVPDKAFPVDLRYQPPVSSHEFLPKQIERALTGLLHPGEQGSLLVFLPGVYEIERAVEALYDQCRSKGYRLLQLHGRMSLQEQQEVLRLPGQEPCVILSTNVAETSLTVPGVTTVIDAGLARIASYDSERERNTLYLSRISLQNARQRTGRAGRLTKGVCVRLWSREDERSMPAAIEPDILRLDLAKAMLMFCALTAAQKQKEDQPVIEWLTPPPVERWSKARDELVRCGAISLSVKAPRSSFSHNIAQADGHCLASGLLWQAPFRSKDNAVILRRPLGGRPLSPLDNTRRPESKRSVSTGTATSGMPLFPLTELGRAMSRLPLEPAVAAVLLQSRTLEEREINAAMAAIWENSEKKLSESHDLFELAGAFLADKKRTEWGREACETFEQIKRIVREEVADADRARTESKKEDIRKEITQAWVRVLSHRIAVQTGEGTVYAFADNRNAWLKARLIIKKTYGHLPQIILALVVHEQAGREQKKKVTIPFYLPLEMEWVAELFPGELQREIECRWNEVRRRVVVEEVSSFRGIALHRHEIENNTQYRKEITSCLAAKLAEGGIWDWKREDPKAEQFICRIKQAALAYPEKKIPQMTDGDWELIYNELSEGKTSLEEIKKSSVIQTVKSYVGPHTAGFVEKKAPDTMILPSGKKGRITYFDNAAPELSARLGDLIGYQSRFTLMDGRVQGVFNILAPNYRTVQKTSDLGSFWKNVYPAIKNELKRKYPKHPWP